MTRIVRLLAVVTFVLGCHSVAQAQSGEDPQASSFSIAKVHIEQNATDGDFEVVFEANSGGEGLAKFTVVSPDGRTVIDYTAAEAATTLGMRHFRLETPEPNDLKLLKAAYPEGAYTLAGEAPSGLKLRGKVTLSHTLPPAVSLLTPKPDAEGVVPKNLRIRWTSVKNLAAYIILIEQPDLGEDITARLPGSASSFAVPDGFLRPGTAYTLEIGSVSQEGNASFIETTFTTAGK